MLSDSQSQFVFPQSSKEESDVTCSKHRGPSIRYSWSVSFGIISTIISANPETLPTSHRAHCKSILEQHQSRNSELNDLAIFSKFSFTYMTNFAYFSFSLFSSPVYTWPAVVGMDWLDDAWLYTIRYAAETAGFHNLGWPSLCMLVSPGNSPGDMSLLYSSCRLIAARGKQSRFVFSKDYTYACCSMFSVDSCKPVQLAT